MDETGKGGEVKLLGLHPHLSMETSCEEKDDRERKTRERFFFLNCRMFENQSTFRRSSMWQTANFPSNTAPVLLCHKYKDVCFLTYRATRQTDMDNMHESD